MSQPSTEPDLSISSGRSQSPNLIKQTTTYVSSQADRETEISKLLNASLTELTNNPSNIENRQSIQALIPISVLLDEMRSDYSSTRTYCLENLDTIALALGPAKAKGLLGGFISNLLKDQDEGVEDVPEEMQVMMTLLSGLPKLIRSIGGPMSGLVLMSPLVETLPDRQKEDTKQMYLKAILEIFEKMKGEKQAQQKAEEYLDEKVKLFQLGNPFEQLSAVQLIAALYFTTSKAQQEKWVARYTQLLNQKEVKKRAIALLAETMKKCASKDALMPIVDLLIAQAPNIPEVHKGQLLYSMPVVMQKQNYLDRAAYVELMQILTEITQLDKSHIQSTFLEIMNDLVEQEENQLLFQTFLKIFRQNETETKNKSCAMIDKVIRHLKSKRNDELINQILVRIKELINDKSTATKLLISDNLLLLLKEDQTFQEEERNQFMRLLMELVDQSDGEFRYKFLQKLNSFETLFKIIKGSCKFSTATEYNFKLCQIICSIQTQKNWRMRQQCCIFISKFVVDLAKFNLEERILVEFSQCIKASLNDRIYSAREEAGKCLNQLCIIARNMKNGQHLVAQYLNDQVEVYKSPNYLVRLGVVLGFKEMFTCLDYAEESQLSKVIQKAAQDIVPNVKLAVIETIFHQFQYLEDKRVKRWIPLFKSILRMHAEDQDLDVKQAAGMLIQIL